MRLTFTALLLAVAAFGQHPAPKNLKLLPADENLIPTMRFFTVALGQKCDFCHMQDDFASDEKHTKEIARLMITLAKDVNAKFPDGKTHVTCYTCHRGATEPATTPPEAAK
jgi:Photosynthetic reaction centre cytochrome C subunit